MVKKPPPRQVLAANLRALSKAHRMSGAAIAAKAKLDPKTVTNMLNGAHGPGVDNVDAVAAVFGLDGWQLIRRDFAATMPEAKEVESLLDLYIAAGKEQREAIMKVAEIAGHYKPK